jgi:hypothetical protein
MKYATYDSFDEGRAIFSFVERQFISRCPFAYEKPGKRKAPKFRQLKFDLKLNPVSLTATWI